MADILCCCCNDGDDGDLDKALMDRYGLGGGDVTDAREVELRCWPSYDGDGYFEEREGRTVYLCRYLVPWCIARLFVGIGLDCGLRLSTGGLPGWMLGTRPGRRCLLVLVLLALLAFVTWTAYARGRKLDAVLSSPCYVCNPTHPERDDDWWWSDSKDPAVRALRDYARYAHGPPCALDDRWFRALDHNSTQRWRDRLFDAGEPTADPWNRYDRLLGGAPRPPRPLPSKGGREDWRRALPRLYVVGCRGAGTTSLSHYLDAHPEVRVRHRPLGHDALRSNHRSAGSIAVDRDKTNAKNKDSVLSTTSTPWDDHFFASVPDWNSDELKGWLRRGWGPPTLRDHQGRGRLRVEVGPDYLWLASTGAASSIRRTRPPAGTDAPRFLVLLTDPVRLVREAHARAVDAGAEDRESLAAVVADELPKLARCLWWDEADEAEQRERIVSGMCGGGGELGRVGPPYLWRGLLSSFVSHWMRAATPGDRRRWYFMRSEDLLQQPNRTLNRLGADFLGLKPFDYGPHVRRVWHPEPGAARTLAPKAPWRQSWKAYVPRTEYLKRARKRVSDALLDAAGKAVRKVVPGLETALKTREKLKRLHCRLAGFVEADEVATQRCLGEHAKKGNAEKEPTQEEKEAMAEEALRDFFAPFQEQLMAMVEATDEARHDPTRHNRDDATTTDVQNTENDDLRKFYLG